MAEEGGDEAVVLAVDGEALTQGVTAMAGGGALVEVVRHEEMTVKEEMGSRDVGVVALSLLHDAYAPVLIGTVSVAEVVGMELGIGTKDEERLMADDHAHTEAAPRENVGSLQTTRSEVVAFSVHQLRLAIDHGRLKPVGGDMTLDGAVKLLQHIVAVETVAGIEKQQIVARGKGDAFVHGVIDTAVGFADEAGDDMTIAGSRRAVAFDNLLGAIGGSAIDDDALNIRECLAEHAPQGVGDGGGGVVGDGDDRETHGSEERDDLKRYAF